MNQKYLSSEGFYFIKPDVLQIKEKIMNQGILLKNISNINIFRGVTTGCNDAFIIDEKTKNCLINKDIRNKKIIHPVLKGKNIKKNNLSFEYEYIIFANQGIDINKYPDIKEYLFQFKEDLTPKKKGDPRNKPGRSAGNYKWYEIQANTKYYPLFEKPKLIFPDISKILFAFYDEEGYYLLNSAYMISLENIYNLKVIQALFCSNVLNFVLNIIGSRLNKNLRLTASNISDLPIKIPKNQEDKNKLIKLIEQIQSDIFSLNSLGEDAKLIKMAEIRKNENKLNRMIYDLYNLDEDDIKVIEDYLENIGDEK